MISSFRPRAFDVHDTQLQWLTREESVPSNLKSVMAILFGLFVGMGVVGLIEFGSSLLFPLPAGLDANDPEAMKKVMSQLPIGALVLVLVAQGLGVLAAAWIAARFAPRAPLAHAMIIGAVFLVASLGNLLMLPHPAWFWLASLVIVLPAAYLGAILARTGRPTTKPNTPLPNPDLA